ncbi:FAR1 DNA binding domain-containing protein [Artemisia annua]|uniref:FAR1 DNA binding domain-containing protein n=1 Tax=Artemisia annua TaxID=35608 RepID=A0A2U1L0E0_ARTAN|nr:FAR1 DNA binding domain-containing protein [Artemisia annua]
MTLYVPSEILGQDDSDICEEIELPDGGFNYKPIIGDFDIPKIGNKYGTLDDCIKMYEEYVEKAGFSIRPSTQNCLKSGIVERKYLVCNREGLAKGVNKDTMNEETSDNQIRTSSISRTGCMARVKFKLNESHTEYVLYDFVEEHNHTFIPVIYRNLTKKKNKLTHKEKMFMQQLGGTNIGATRAHHLYAATNGGYDEVDATETEFRNQTRDLNSHIDDSDAQMLINKMETG